VEEGKVERCDNDWAVSGHNMTSSRGQVRVVVGFLRTMSAFLPLLRTA
jgi:hypothetical protein